MTIRLHSTDTNTVYTSRDIVYTISFSYLHYDFTIYVVQHKAENGCFLVYFVSVRDNYVSFLSLISALRFKLEVCAKDFRVAYENYLACNKDINALNTYQDSVGTF